MYLNPNIESVSLPDELKNINIQELDTDDKKIKCIKNCLIFVEKNIHSKNLVFGTSQDWSFYTQKQNENLYRLGIYTSFYQCRLNYTPPEVLFENYFAPTSDMWILGYFIYKIITGEDLFKIDEQQDLTTKYKNIYSLKDQIKNFDIKNITEQNSLFKTLLNDTLQVNPELRKNTAHLLKYFNIEYMYKPIKIVKKTEITIDNNLIDLNKIIENEFKYKIYLKENDKYFLHTILNDFLKINKNNIFKTVLDNEELFFIKFIIITKTTILYIMIQKGILHPENDKLFIDEFLSFNNMETEENALIKNISNKVFNHISKYYCDLFI